MSKLRLDTPVQYLKGVGPKMAQKLATLQIKTIEDLVCHFPFRHEDYSIISPIAQIKEEVTVTVIGQIASIENSYLRSARQKTIQKAILKDNSGIVPIVWFNQPYLVKIFTQPKMVSVSGKVSRKGRQLQFTSPRFEVIGTGETIPANNVGQPTTTHTGRLVPIYPSTFGLGDNYLRRIINLAISEVGDQIEEFLPEKIISQEGLIGEKEAIAQIHFPKNKLTLEKAKKRIAFDELFLLQLSHLLNKRQWQIKQPAPVIKKKPKLLKQFINSLPFNLTNCQKLAIDEILNDLGGQSAMNRLLQGDVGSGKTVVAAAAILTTVKNGYQSVIMVPTEILAQQHYQNLGELLTPFGISAKLISRSTKKDQTGNKVQLFVGTHALIHRYQEFEKIGLVIIDEQHRFGVSQRAKLIAKANLGDRDQLCPHILTMTATPIPRTITLTVYGDLEVSSLNKMPAGRKPVKTYLVPNTKRTSCYQWVREQIEKKGFQAFIVCPLIEESETLESVKSATKEYQRLKKEVFADQSLALIHGKIKSKEKEEILLKMKNGQIDILVATPVVEVGIDIPKANIMLVEGANRFGLAQLHQLRGRVGRRGEQAFCFLFTEKMGQKARQRLKAMEQSTDGMKLAEIDLKIRGPGEVYGTQQHGFPEFKVASYNDLALMQKARTQSQKILRASPSLDVYPRLKEKINKKTSIAQTIAN